MTMPNQTPKEESWKTRLPNVFDYSETFPSEGKYYVSALSDMEAFIETEITLAVQTERERIKKEITGLELLNLNSETYVGLGDALWVCDSQEERDAFTNAISLTPPIIE